MESLVIREDPEYRHWWKKTIQSLLPNLNVVLLDEDEYDPLSITYAAVCNPPTGTFKRFPNIKCVASIGAGVWHILKDPEYPKDVPIIRCVSEALRMRMSEYVILHVLRFHRRLPEVEMAQANRKWKQFIAPLASEVNVGIMGLGNLGGYAAKKLQYLGYNVHGYSRRKKELKNVISFYGEDQLNDFLSKTNILICMLPQTPLTENILSQKSLSVLPEKSYLINVGRGKCLVENDLIEALASNQLSAATLDVFNDEPLPLDHPFWSHPKILVTGHSAGMIDPAIGGLTIADNIKAFIRGDELPNIVDIEQGY